MAKPAAISSTRPNLYVVEDEQVSPPSEEITVGPIVKLDDFLPRGFVLTDGTIIELDPTLGYLPKYLGDLYFKKRMRIFPQPKTGCDHAFELLYEILLDAATSPTPFVVDYFAVRLCWTGSISDLNAAWYDLNRKMDKNRPGLPAPRR